MPRCNGPRNSLAERSRLTNLATKPERLGSAGEAGAAGADKPKRLDGRRTERALPTRCWCVSGLLQIATKAQRPVAKPSETERGKDTKTEARNTA